MSDLPPVRHEPEANRFVIFFEDGSEAAAAYRETSDRLVLTHTQVPHEHEGQGHATRLAEAAFAYADEHGLRVRPACSFMRTFAARHPGVQSLVA